MFLVDELASLSRRKITCDDVLCGLLGLGQLQVRIYWLLSRDELEVSEVASEMGRDRTSVQRALQSLISAGLVTRRPMPARRGRRYSYRGVPVAELKRMLHQVLEGYRRNIAAQIDSIGEAQP